MQKVLLTTTALVAFTGAAAADITLSGRAEMGIFGGDEITTTFGAATTTMEDQFFTDIDVSFTMSGETDNGLTFGASVDLDEGGDGSAASDDNTDDGGATIFLSGPFGTVTMGDTDGALDFALTEGAGNAGSLADDETAHAGYLGSYADGAYDGQILRYDYSIGDFAVAVSVEQDDTGVRDTGYAIGGRYSFGFSGGSVDFGAGYQFAEVTGSYLPGNLNDDVIGTPFFGDTDVIGVSAAVSLDNGLSGSVQYSDWDFAIGPDTTHVNVSAGYSFDAFTVSGNYGIYDIDTVGDVEGFGLAASYDLGGGAVVHAGYGSSDYSDFAPALDAVETYSFGIAFSF